MKNNIRSILFVISVFYSLITIVLMFICNKNIVTTLELYDSSENKIKLEKYKEEVALLEKNSCIESINKIITHYEETAYDGAVSLKEMYEYDFESNLISYYTKLKENCNINEEIENKYNLPLKFIAASIQRDEIYQSYYFQYELTLTDYRNRLIVEPQMSGLEYSISRGLELEIIDILIEISREEGAINE